MAVEQELIQKNGEIERACRMVEEELALMQAASQPEQQCVFDVETPWIKPAARSSGSCLWTALCWMDGFVLVTADASMYGMMYACDHAQECHDGAAG